MFIVITIELINIDIIIIDLILVPNQINIIGPNATFGKLLISVRYGSTILAIFGKNHNMLAHVIDNSILIIKLNNNSYNVVFI
jgi:hypothetical protein